MMWKSGIKYSLKWLEKMAMLGPCAWESEAGERENRHKEKLAMMRVEMDVKLNKNSEFFINILREAGISIPDNAPWQVSRL
ncbi:hypothetical protein LguiB_001465 [Lonicera macranthoides]